MDGRYTPFKRIKTNRNRQYKKLKHTNFHESKDTIDQQTTKHIGDNEFDIPTTKNQTWHHQQLPDIKTFLLNPPPWPLMGINDGPDCSDFILFGCCLRQTCFRIHDATLTSVFSMALDPVNPFHCPVCFRAPCWLYQDGKAQASVCSACKMIFHQCRS